MHERARKIVTVCFAVAVAVAGAGRFETGAQTRALSLPARPAAAASAAPRFPGGRKRTQVLRSASAAVASAGTVLLDASFAGTGTTTNRYVVAGATCITAGTGTNSTSYIPGCLGTAPLDPNGAGALQLTQPIAQQVGFIATNPGYSTAAGLILTFNDYSFGGTPTGADGVVAFFTDGSKSAPNAAGQPGGSLGYANGSSGLGVANAYVGVALDEYGGFSSATEGRIGGPGRVSESVAVRGAAASNWQYLTGATDVNGSPVSLPFNLDRPSTTTRPANAPTVQITLTATGVLSVAIDFHDGNGFVNYVKPTNIVGLGGQPAVPAAVHVGFSSSTGGFTSRHQIGSVRLTTIGGITPPPTPPPTPTPIPTPPPPPPASQDNTTYHNNNLRTGWYQHETTLTTANVGSNAFHLIGTLATGGKSYSQPLYLTAQRLADGSTHNLLIVTDSTDVVYAFDADTLTRVWTHDFKSSGVRQQFSSDTGCDDTYPNVGINGTPVIDRNRNRMYVVVPTNENGAYHLRLHALSLSNGSDAVSAVEVSGSIALASGGTAKVDPQFNFNRAGLLETNNAVYVALSSHCDSDSDAAHGWLISYDPDTLGRNNVLINSTNKDLGTFSGSRFLGTIWQSGFAIAADAQSNIFFATGNGPNDNGGSDYGMSVLRVPSNLDITKRSFFTPSTWLNESLTDNDLGSGGVMLLPDQASGPFPRLAIAGGKTGMKYLLNRDNLGGLNSTDNVLLEGSFGGRTFGGPAYFVDPSGKQKILYGGTPFLQAFTLNTAAGYGLTLTSSTNVGPLESRNGGGVTPVVSSNGTQSGTAVVWAIKGPPGNVNGAGSISLYAFDGADLGHTLFAATAGRWIGNGDTGGVLITPLVANGRVYLATDGSVSVFGTH